VSGRLSAFSGRLSAIGDAQSWSALCVRFRKNPEHFSKNRGRKKAQKRPDISPLKPSALPFLRLFAATILFVPDSRSLKAESRPLGSLAHLALLPFRVVCIVRA
jgi:hypothetical protein